MSESRKNEEGRAFMERILSGVFHAVAKMYPRSWYQGLTFKFEDNPDTIDCYDAFGFLHALNSLEPPKKTKKPARKKRGEPDTPRPKMESAGPGERSNRVSNDAAKAFRRGLLQGGPWIRAKDIAKVWNVTSHMIYTAVRCGELNATRVGIGLYFKKEDVDDWMEWLTNPGGSEDQQPQ